MIKTNKTYDLESRTSKFGEDIIEFTRNLKKDIISMPIISQLKIKIYNLKLE